MNRNIVTVLALAAAYALTLYMLSQSAFALPAGATITFNETAGTPTQTPSNRSDARGTITTVILNGVQQDQYWKAYVGNITGRLSLDDASGNTIYDWPISVNKVGEVYISRHSSLNFSNVTCASVGNISAEQGYYGMVETQADSINRTFNATSHQSFLVGALTITTNTCRSTATYRNDTAQNMDGSQTFQELILQDNTNKLVFVTFINASTSGFDNREYDFQAIVPESAVNSSTTYYFYTELG